MKKPAYKAIMILKSRPPAERAAWDNLLPWGENGGTGALGAHFSMDEQRFSRSGTGRRSGRTGGRRLAAGTGTGNWGVWIGLGVLFLALLYLCWLFPVTGDDWFREELGRKLNGPVEMWKQIVSAWQTYNGRILGNLLSYTAGGRKLLREVLRALFTVGTFYFAARNGGFRSLWGVLLTAAALLALPRPMFAQIYPWAAGFFNYVPPAMLLLWALWLLRDVFTGRLVQEHPARTAGVFLLAFSSQLFMENYTLYALWAGVVLVVWYRLWQRRWSPGILSFFLGAVLGAAVLFLSPSYGKIFGGGGAYGTGLGSGLSGLWATVLEQQGEVLRYLISGCPVLFLSLTVLSLVWFASSRRAALDWVCAAVLAVGCVYFLLNQFGTVLPQWNPLAVLSWGLALGVGLWRWLPRGERRNRGLFFWASSAVAAFPLLFVSPVGPRCLYLSYVCLWITASCLLTALPLESLPVPVRRGVPLILAAAVLGSYLWVFMPIHRVEQVRDAALEQAMAAGQQQVVLPAFPHGDYLWEGDSTKVTSRYYYQTPGDLTVLYVPAAEWAAGNQ